MPSGRLRHGFFMPASFTRQESVFSRALALAPGERSEFLNATCGQEPSLRVEIDELLAAQADLDAEPATGGSDADGTGDERRIGPYRVLEPLGEGGCGIVYLAEQTAPVRRRVALKLIKPGMDTRAVMVRFEAERQALALMDHPGIARVFDAGATSTGRLYFAMELVRGTRITDFCDQHRLGVAARLRLFIQVCHAVQHAHQKGVIHRDLKPSNILVTRDDTTGGTHPKVIDFGIAKAAHGHLTDHTLHTGLAQFIGTPAYMSPEQAAGGGIDVDTRSDVYSLGVVLHELLAGMTPLDGPALMRSGLEEMRRAICERETARPSSRVRAVSENVQALIAGRRGVGAARLAEQLAGDLDWIVLRALEKDRTRRYATAAELAADVQRHLDHEPVQARPPGRWYRLTKFARRHRTAMTAAIAVVGALIVGLGFATAGFHRAVVARHEAERQRVRAEDSRHLAEAARGRAEGLLGFMLQDLQPSLEQYGRLPLLQRVAEESVRYFEELPAEFGGLDTDQNRAAALEALAGVSTERGDHTGADALYREALQLRQRVAAARPDDAVAHVQMAQLRWTQFYWDHSVPEMDRIYADAVDRLQKALTREPDNAAVKRWLAIALANQAFHLGDRYTRAEGALTAGIEAARLWSELLIETPHDNVLRARYAQTLTSLAIAHERRLDHEAAVRVSHEALTQLDTAIREDPSNTGLLEGAGQAAMMLSYRMIPLSEARSRDAELVARSHWQALMEIDPSNAWYRHRYAWAHMMECYHLQTTRDIAATRAAFARFQNLLEPVAQYPDDFEKLQQNHGFQGQLAAQAGEHAAARAHLQALREWHHKTLASLPEVEALAPPRRVRRLLAESWIIEALGDWSELERVGRELLVVLEGALRATPDDAQLLLDRAYAGRVVGLALLRTGYASEAGPVLERALENFHAAPPVATVMLDRAEVTVTTRDTLAEARAAGGDREGARRLLEVSLAERERQLNARPELWPRHRLLARTSRLLASMMDEEDDRRALVERVSTMLAGPG